VRRSSAALLLALIAVIGVWAGPAVAGRLLTSKDIKDRSLKGRDFKANTITGRVVAGLSGRDIKDDTLDGADIDESMLGQVPSAARADSAATAESVNGATISRVNFAAAAGTAETTIYEGGGLRLAGACDSASELSVLASTPTGPAFLRSGGTRAGSGGSAAAFFARDDDLRAGESFGVVPGDADDAVGELVFAGPDGAVVTVDFMAEQAIAPGRGQACLFAGTAVQTPG